MPRAGGTGAVRWHIFDGTRWWRGAGISSAAERNVLHMPLNSLLPSDVARAVAPARINADNWQTMAALPRCLPPACRTTPRSESNVMYISHLGGALDAYVYMSRHNQRGIAWYQYGRPSGVIDARRHTTGARHHARPLLIFSRACLDIRRNVACIPGNSLSPAATTRALSWYRRARNKTLT